ncbi:protein downstream neighbor of son homolog [Babylonia areolata]|uniref:protein downstream neighbor of son homolog n=1 Tax=Babylonia areolata TaxID=304850 RepID=UPI003FD4811A
MSQDRQQWTKPKDIMRTRSRQKRRSKEAGEQSGADGSKTERSPGNTDALHLMGDAGRKRKNPFDVSSSATRRATESAVTTSPVSADGDSTAGGRTETKVPRLLSALNNASQEAQNAKGKNSKAAVPAKEGQVTSPSMKSPDSGAGEMSSKRRPAPLSSPDPDRGGAGDTAMAQHQEAGDQEADQSREGVPLDWSLKAKLRIVLDTDLLPASRLADDRNAALTRFMLMEPSPHRKAGALSGFVHSRPLHEEGSAADGERMLYYLRQCCHYWVTPSLPGFPAFPRILPPSAFRDHTSLELADKPELQKALHKNWVESFGSVYEQLKTDQCPYFYVCCQQFTALFFVHTAGGRKVSACITPTTRGLRQALLREGVEYTLPYQTAHTTQRTTAAGKKNTGSQGEGDNDDDDEDDEDDDTDITSTDEGASMWLRDVGLDQKCFPTLQPSKVKIQREGYQQVDGRRESLVLCQGREVQALYNFLLNTRQCVAATGPQAGIPPSILAPSHFLGATLKSNQIQHSLAKVSGGSLTDTRHVMEISGPLMPHQLLNISALLQDHPGLMAHLSLNTHQPSVPLNIPHTPPPVLVQGTSSTGHTVPPSATPSPGSGDTNTAFSPSWGPAQGLRSDPRSQQGQGSGTAQHAGGQVTVHSRQRSECDSVDHSHCSCYCALYRGLHPSVRHRLATPTTLPPDTALREIHCQAGVLTWDS